MNIRELFEISPIITVIKNGEGPNHAMETDGAVIFILYGTILSIQKIVGGIKGHRRPTIAHVDLVAGFSSRGVVIDFIRENTSADGIINIEPVLAHHAIKLGLIGGQHAFLIDSMALDNMKGQLESFRPDFMELMPGVMPSVLHTIRQVTDIPLVTGGLLSDKKDTMAAFNADVDAVSTTKGQL